MRSSKTNLSFLFAVIVAVIFTAACSEKIVEMPYTSDVREPIHLKVASPEARQAYSEGVRKS